MYKFKETKGLRKFLLQTVGSEFELPSNNNNEISYYQNGDEMTVNLADGTILWQPLKPGEMFNSKLSLRFHQWFGKGLIEVVK